jgi:hypothetical protein
MTEIADRARENAATVQAKINETRAMINIFVDIDKDFESLISSCVVRLLGTEGFKVTSTKKTANVICAVTVDEGFQHRENTGDFYNPKITIVGRGTGGDSLFSYSKSAARQAATTPDVAKRRAYTVLVNELDKNFLTELGHFD